MQTEIQKVSTQKEYFEHSIAKLEKDLRDAIDAADTTERDAKYLLLMFVYKCCIYIVRLSLAIIRFW